MAHDELGPTQLLHRDPAGTQKQTCFISKAQGILYQSQDLQELYQLVEIQHFCLAPRLGCEEIAQVCPVAPTKGNGKLLTIFSPYRIL